MNERDRREFGEFVAARSGALIGLAYVLTADQHAAEDLLQTALTRAAARWGRIHSAVLVPLAVLSAASHPAPGPPLTGSAGTHWPPPIQLQQVARVTGHRCPPRSHGLPGTSKDECFYLTHTGMTISRFAITITNPPAGTSDYELSFRLQRADVRRFADLTQKLANSPSPHDQMAFIVNRVVLLHPAVFAALDFGVFQLPAGHTRAQAQELLHMLEHRRQPPSASTHRRHGHLEA